MELRKDPITLAWMLIGDDDSADGLADGSGACSFCDPATHRRALCTVPGAAVRVYPHPRPVYRIEGDEGREAVGIYDRMSTVGAHEVVVEADQHDRRLWDLSDAECAPILKAWADRIVDLKRDTRFRHISVFKNYGPQSGVEIAHPHSEITATSFVPRRVAYELRAARSYYHVKERCVFCDVVRQEERQGPRVVETTRSYVALCPFASRVPYELWILPRYHGAFYEKDLASRGDSEELAGLLRRSLARVTAIAESFHLVLHTAPNTATQRGPKPKWTTVEDDYHWHFEILPITQRNPKAYSIKEVYFNSVSPEFAAGRLRSAG